MVSGRQKLLWQNVLENLVFDFFKEIKIILQEKYSLVRYDLRTFKLQRRSWARASRERSAAWPSSLERSEGSAPESTRNVQIFASTDLQYYLKKKYIYISNSRFQWNQTQNTSQRIYIL